MNEVPAHGDRPSDVTAYKASQMTWTKALAHRPAILTLWEAPLCTNGPTDDIGRMTFNGQVVLDYTGTAIRAFDLPWAISSAVEGYRVEAWLRADRRMKLTDIVARVYTELSGIVRLPIYDDRSLATRSKRFREEAGLVSWRVQHAKPEAIAWFDSLRSQAQKDNNLAVQRELTKAERSQYTWITLDKNLDVDRAKPDRLIKRMKLLRRYHQQAMVNYPEGEFKPGARDAGDLLEYSYGEPDGESELLMDDVSEHDIARPSVPAPSSSPTGSIAGQANIFDDDNEQDRFDYLNPERWQNNRIENSASASYGQRRLAENFNEVLSDSSIHSEPEDPTDSRNDEPASVEETQMLQSALEQTIADYNELSGGSIPEQTNPTENYFSQWAALQTQFNMFWTELWDNSNAPTLRGLGRWTGGITNWQTASLARTDRVIGEEEAWAMYSEG